MTAQLHRPTLPKFDPFENRLCRDIRNELSKHLMEVIAKANFEIVSPIVNQFLNRDLEPFMRDYLNKRLARYRKVFTEIKVSSLQPHDTYAIAVLLWNQELFFEVHEWLEKKWLMASGTEKSILQALIRAAGTYVHLEHGREQGAKKMATKAIDSLIQHQALVPAMFNVETLIAKLEALDPDPPKFN